MKKLTTPLQALNAAIAEWGTVQALADAAGLDRARISMARMRAKQGKHVSAVTALRIAKVVKVPAKRLCPDLP